ncbi:MAG: glutamine--fructose-6-phosphate transaminase (isomerizing) [Oscillospiraceae bacterium]|jgi:glucosamine--fructose-6-phosphate aminotransferase (isomerizing)|nr:glutamine--fructose-6-phosphate transaminase (isomerizing) [Oscillospiraceae bacterium]
MCGIIGYVGTEDTVPIILEGLKKLEYRGYDSAGLAILDRGAVSVVKQKGRLTALEEALRQNPLTGHIGIGHTRWATHGEPSDTNSHPHLGSQRKIAIVHNGIIENHRYLRETLERKGVVFHSETDSEIVAQLAEYYHRGDIMDTVIRVTNALEGSYALGFLCADDPDKLIAVRKDNPLIIGLSDGGNFIASDVPAVLKHTNKICYLEDREIAVLEKDRVTFYSRDREVIHKTPETISWNFESAEKGGYKHFMFKEIMEQPRVLRDTIRSALPGGTNHAVIEALDIGRYSQIFFTACGSAYNVSMVGKYVLERLCRFPVTADLASEFRYRDAVIDARTLVIVISQSGETADSIAALREAKRKGADTLAIVNVVGSTIAKEADHTVYTMAGPEIAVATTKAFSAQLALLYLLAVRFARGLGRVTPPEEAALLADLEELPDQAEALFAHVDRIQQYAATCFNCKSIFFIGRNVDYAIALEGSLKLKEISYIHSEAYAGGELKHGTISLIEEGTLVVAIACTERLYGKTASNVEQVLSRGARVLFLTSSGETEETDCLSLLPIRPVSEWLAPSLSVIWLQLFSYYVAVYKGCDIDKPRNLAKSVTVE